MSGRTLVVDSSLNRRIATELKGRGRDAVGLAELGLARAPDVDLLRGLGRRFPPGMWVFLTADDVLPAEHVELVAELGMALATIEWRSPAPAAGREQTARETCHRWAHVMVAQPAGTIHRYSPQRHRPWADRRR